MSDIYFFGYGSLVNSLTHGYAPTHHATAQGWRRAWRYTPDRKLAYLTAIRAPGHEIDGLIAPVPQDGWATLDLREHAYDRLPATHAVAHPATASEIAIYAIHPDRLHIPDDDHPVLLSYVDVVLQGYLREFGKDGALRFVATTDGWEAPMLNDRANPIYPRAQRLDPAERAFVDDTLHALGCKVLVP
ncbi:gamma-glutamylcyclotransferase family protein [Tropicibacter oceani]|uniref:Gamma-glutamylcyclotransferase n=1 Tax=Tropicibacter oceani TaxID=3058420 RepID=A0ABY8QJT6_9RHOB|nr:gamma-glutamylcyclotransferase family protein [Tropicibacter oceani]WGW04780.1 gamma-glutamylcyclotransferase [Tropicibacter oceani]